MTTPDDPAKQMAAELRRLAWSEDADQWPETNASRFRDVDLTALLQALDQEFSVYDHERRALETLMRCAERTRPEAIPALVFRLLELLKRLEYDYELPPFHECLLQNAKGLPAALYQALLLDLFHFYEQVNFYGMWWYALAWRDVVKLMLCLPPVKSPYIGSVAGELPERACEAMPWDIPYLDLVIHLGYRQDRPELWRDAIDQLFPRLTGDHRAVEEANRLLNSARWRAQRPAIPARPDLRRADQREDGAQASFALRIVAHLAGCEEPEYRQAAEILAQPALAAWEAHGLAGAQAAWSALAASERKDLALALEAYDVESVARLLGVGEKTKPCVN
jgi:hypothetical protein